MTTTGEQSGTQTSGTARIDPQTVRRAARPPADDALVMALAAAAAAVARRTLRGDRPDRPADAAAPAPPTVPAATTVLADRPDGTVVRVGGVVAKAHAPGTDAAALAVRIAVAGHPLLRGILLPPLSPLPPATTAVEDGTTRTDVTVRTDGPEGRVRTDGTSRNVRMDGPVRMNGPEGRVRTARVDGTAGTDGPDGTGRTARTDGTVRLGGPYGEAVRGRPVTVWPYGVPVDRHDPAAAPWAEAAVLLARLHTVPEAALPGPLPPMRGPAKAALAVARLRGVADSAAARTVRRAWRRLPAWARDEAPHPGPAALCHGDLHLGQLVRHPAPDGGWLLIDVDDLGTGPAAWDLARPAMWFAAGLLVPDAWALFLAAYRAAGGPAVPETGDPWAQLDVPARALAVQTAAIGVAKAARDGRELDEAESELVATCARIAQLE